MTKQQFLENLRAKLSDLPMRDLDERLSFYGEMIDDRIEEGLSEEAAVWAIGSADAVASEVIRETAFAVHEQVEAKKAGRLKWWEIVLLAVGSPLWAALLIAALAVVVALVAAAWAVVAAFWGCLGAFAGGAVGGVATAVIVMYQGHIHSGMALIGASLVCAGLGILWFYGSLALTKVCGKLMAVCAKKAKRYFKKGGKRHA